MADLPSVIPVVRAPFRGGAAAARNALGQIDPIAYGASRNHLDGAVTRLSPYLRHGVLTLPEVREAVFAWLRERGYGSPERRVEGQRVAGKLISELGWRDYWQRLWLLLGDGLWHDLEPLKTGHPAASYAPEMPADVAAAATGLACIDAFAGELMATGWLHNHARLWLASYLVHWRRVQWQAGARWFLQHLLDGDPASNNLSWQWVASTFSAKPYIFNRANLERFGGERHCRGCALAGAGCPFEASYESLQERLFSPPALQGNAQGESPAAVAPFTPSAAPAAVAPGAALLQAGQAPRRPVLWLHHEALGPANPALSAWPAAPALVVLDPALGTSSGSSPLRHTFLQECALELPAQLRHGSTVEQVLALVAAHGADAVVTTGAVDPRLQAITAQLAVRLPLVALEPEPFVRLESPPDLRRFSRYWRQAEPLVWRSFERG